MQDLINCPFCGGKARLSPITKIDGKWWGYVVCENTLECGAELGGCSLDEAVRRWNERWKEKTT